MTATIADRIEEIRKREQAATAGPWKWDAEVPLEYEEDYYKENAPWLVQALFPEPAIVKGEIAVPNSADAAFIATARTDIPMLLAALEEALSEIEYMKECDDIFDRRKMARNLEKNVSAILGGAK